MFSQTKVDGSSPARGASHCVAATRIAGKGAEGIPDEETVARARRAGADGRSSSAAVIRLATLGRLCQAALPRPTMLGSSSGSLRRARTSRSTTRWTWSDLGRETSGTRLNDVG